MESLSAFVKISIDYISGAVAYFILTSLVINLFIYGWKGLKSLYKSMTGTPDAVFSESRYQVNRVNSEYEPIKRIVQQVIQDAVKDGIKEGYKQAHDSPRELKSNSIKCTLLKNSKLRPRDRPNASWYVTLFEEFPDAEIKHMSTVVMDGVNYRVASSTCDNTHGCCSSSGGTIPFTIYVPKGFQYGINDHEKDPIGLPKVLDIDTEFEVEPGTRVVLNEGTILLTTHGTKIVLINDTRVNI